MAFLYTADNPHAPRRSNGRRFWGQPNRHGGTLSIRAIGLHTAETTPSPASAENVARWLRDSAPAPASYHEIVDVDSNVTLLPDAAVAFGIANFNTPTLHISFATYAAWWGRYPTWDTGALERGAAICRRWCDLYDIPVRLITATQARNGQRGFVTHASMDPSRRTDPGAGFPMNRFLALVSQEEDMPLTDQDAEKVAAAVWRHMVTHPPGDDGTDRFAHTYLRWAFQRSGDAMLAAREAAKAAKAAADGDRETASECAANAEAIVDEMAARLAREDRS